MRNFKKFKKFTYDYDGSIYQLKLNRSKYNMFEISNREVKQHVRKIKNPEERTTI